MCLADLDMRPARPDGRQDPVEDAALPELGDSEATPRQRRIAAAAAALLIPAAGAATAPGFAAVPAPGAVGAASLLGGLMAAGLLLGRLRRRPATTALAAGCLVAGAAALPRLFGFPETFRPGDGAADWFPLFGHAGFAGAALGYALLRAPDDGATRLKPALLAGAAATAAVAALAGFGHQGPGILLWALDAAALAAVIALTGCRRLLDLWLAAALFAMLLAAGLTLAGGWPAARLLELFAALAVPAALLHEAAQTFRRLVERNEALRRQAGLDSLTGLANRRQFDGRLDQEWRRAAREGRALSLLLIDIDCFKPFNDCYGHLAGDECVRRIAALAAGAARRAADLAARYGGEEFAVILPETDEANAAMLAHRLVEAARHMAIPHEGNTAAGVATVSVGAATMRPDGRGRPQDLVAAADAALYAAKRGGRNQVRCAGKRAAAPV